MSYTPSEGHGAKAEGRRGVPRSEGGPPSTQNSRVRRTLLDRERSKIRSKAPPLVPQADLGEAVPAHEGAVSAF